MWSGRLHELFANARKVDQHNCSFTEGTVASRRSLQPDYANDRHRSTVAARHDRFAQRHWPVGFELPKLRLAKDFINGSSPERCRVAEDRGWPYHQKRWLGTIREMAGAGIARGYEYIAITDSYPDRQDLNLSLIRLAD